MQLRSNGDRTRSLPECLSPSRELTRWRECWCRPRRRAQSENRYEKKEKEKKNTKNAREERATGFEITSQDATSEVVAESGAPAWFWPTIFQPLPMAQLAYPPDLARSLQCLRPSVDQLPRAISNPAPLRVTQLQKPSPPPNRSSSAINSCHHPLPNSCP